MYIETATPKFVSIERFNDYGKIAKVIVRVDSIDYVEVSLSKVYFLNESSITRVTRESIEALQNALLGLDDKEINAPAIQLS